MPPGTRVTCPFTFDDITGYIHQGSQWQVTECTLVEEEVPLSDGFMKLTESQWDPGHEIWLLHSQKQWQPREMPNSAQNFPSGNRAVFTTYCSGPTALRTRLQKLPELPQENHCAYCLAYSLSELGCFLTLLTSSSLMQGSACQNLSNMQHPLISGAFSSWASVILEGSQKGSTNGSWVSHWKICCIKQV